MGIWGKVVSVAYTEEGDMVKPEELISCDVICEDKKNK
jgi:hypothetical protein